MYDHGLLKLFPELWSLTRTFDTREIKYFLFYFRQGGGERCCRVGYGKNSFIIPRRGNSYRMESRKSMETRTSSRRTVLASRLSIRKLFETLNRKKTSIDSEGNSIQRHFSIYPILMPRLFCRARVKSGLRILSAIPSTDRWNITVEINPKHTGASVTALRREPQEPEQEPSSIGE